MYTFKSTELHRIHVARVHL